MIGECVVLFKFKVIVKDDERAFLLRDGRFERLLDPGRFVALDYGRRLTAEVVKVARAEIAADKALLFAKAHPAIAAEHFEIVQAGPSEVAIVALDGEPKHLILPNTTRAFWKTITKVDVERIDAAAEPRVAKRHLDKLGRVGMWRGGFRLNRSVSASFVWRCLSGAAVTPFPHSAHRTRTGGSPTSGSRTRPHAFAHGSSCPSRHRRTSPKCP